MTNVSVAVRFSKSRGEEDDWSRRISYRKSMVSFVALVGRGGKVNTWS